MRKKLRLIGLLVTCLMPFGKIFIYRLLFSANIGQRVKIGFGAVLLFDELTIGDDCKISPLCIVRVKTARIGMRCKIGLFTRIYVHTLKLDPSVTIAPQVSIMAELDDPRCEFSAGAESWIFEYCYINPVRAIRLGRNVGVGGGSYIFAHGLWSSALAGYPVAFGEVTIGNDVWLPWGCFIMPGVAIGDGAVIGARSVVTKNVPSMALAAGIPAKILKDNVARPVSHEEKLALLLKSTEEFCSLGAIALEARDGEDGIRLVFDGVPAIALAKGEHAFGEQDRQLLKVIPGRLCDAGQQVGPMYSLTSFQCSPRKSLSAVQKSWLQHLRRIGTRHYPVDEVLVEESR